MSCRSEVILYQHLKREAQTLLGTPNYNQLNLWPLQFLRTGYYRRSYGYLGARTADGDWWSATAGSTTHGRYLGSWTGDVNALGSNFRGYGFALRWVVQLA